AFFAGLTVENASMVVLLALIIYIPYSYLKKDLDKKLIVPLIAFASGVSIFLFSPSTTIRRNYYNSLGLDGNLVGIRLYINRFVKINYDLVKISWALIAIFSISLLIYLLIERRNHKSSSKGEGNNNHNRLSMLEILAAVFIAYLSVAVLIGISYHNDQRRGFAFFWFILISLTAYIMTELWGYLAKKWQSVITIIPLIVLILSFYKMDIVYTQFNRENSARLEMIYSAIQSGKRQVSLPAISIKDSRILETREILPDLGERLATYYGLESVIIER
ncbi:MAG: DUF6056 family protein, partial [Acidobacteriaceae bacterium]